MIINYPYNINSIVNLKNYKRNKKKMANNNMHDIQCFDIFKSYSLTLFIL